MKYDLEKMVREPLHPDLEPFVEENGPMGRQLRHPLVYQIPLHAPGLANQQYMLKLEMVVKAFALGDPANVLVYLERPYRMTALLEFAGKGGVLTDLLSGRRKPPRSLTIEELRDQLVWAWQDCEHPRQFGYRALIRLFRRAGPLTDGPELPTEPIEVYRGVDNRRDARGLSWTRDLERAKWFAQRFSSIHKGRHVYRTIAPPSAVLAVFERRNEQEVVLDPKGLLLEEYSWVDTLGFRPCRI